MRGLGTIINALAIVIGGVLGILFKRFLKERYQDTIIKATGFSAVSYTHLTLPTILLV